MTCSKKTHTQRHGTFVVYTQVSSSSQFSQLITRKMCTPGWVKEARVPDSDVVLFQQKHHCPTTVNEAHVPSRFLRLDDRKRETTSSYSQETKQEHCREAVGTSTRPVACTVKNLKSHSSSSSIAEVISPATLCFWICGHRNCKHQVHQEHLQRSIASGSDVGASAQQPQPNGLFATEKTTTQHSMERAVLKQRNNEGVRLDSDC